MRIGLHVYLQPTVSLTVTKSDRINKLSRACHTGLKLLLKVHSYIYLPATFIVIFVSIKMHLMNIPCGLYYGAAR
jgi:hypothetical protein